MCVLHIRRFIFIFKFEFLYNGNKIGPLEEEERLQVFLWCLSYFENPKFSFSKIVCKSQKWCFLWVRRFQGQLYERSNSDLCFSITGFDYCYLIGPNRYVNLSILMNPEVNRFCYFISDGFCWFVIWFWLISKTIRRDLKNKGILIRYLHGREIHDRRDERERYQEEATVMVVDTKAATEVRVYNLFHITVS